MAYSKELMKDQIGSLAWIQDLAKAEIHPDAERLFQLGKSFDPHQLVEESALDFLSELRECFSEYARLFNAHSDNGGKYQEVKIYGVAQSPADFMVFRNQIKLVASNIAHGVIQLSFAQHVRQQLSVDGQLSQSAVGLTPANGVGQAQDLLAQVGPFRDIYWTYQGERVTPAQIARFYFSEFVRITRDNRRSRANNQVLLEQIKSLLQEKGLEL